MFCGQEAMFLPANDAHCFVLKQATQQLVTDSPWDTFPVFQKISRNASELLNAGG
jgi:hypothetical protein